MCKRISVISRLPIPKQTKNINVFLLYFEYEKEQSMTFLIHTVIPLYPHNYSQKINYA